MEKSYRFARVFNLANFILINIFKKETLKRREIELRVIWMGLSESSQSLIRNAIFWELILLTHDANPKISTLSTQQSEKPSLFWNKTRGHSNPSRPA
ncbi:MAG: hypothetical protein U0798_13940 [Gemmataceae bacterium]